MSKGIHKNTLYNKIFNLLKEYGRIEENQTAYQLEMLSKIYELTESKQLTTEELREQFETVNKGFYTFIKNKDGEYRDYKLQYIWIGWLQYYRTNNLLKE